MPCFQVPATASRMRSAVTSRSNGGKDIPRQAARQGHDQDGSRHADIMLRRH
jgi:hypothetical protein